MQDVEQIISKKRKYKFQESSSMTPAMMAKADAIVEIMEERGYGFGDVINAQYTNDNKLYIYGVKDRHTVVRVNVLYTGVEIDIEVSSPDGTISQKEITSKMR